MLKVYCFLIVPDLIYVHFSSGINRLIDRGIHRLCHSLVMIQRISPFIDINLWLLLPKVWNLFLLTEHRYRDLWVFFVSLHTSVLIWVEDDVRDDCCY